MDQNNVVKKTIKKLQEKWEQKFLLIGFDGFIDEIIHVVDERDNYKQFTRINTITGLSERIASAAGLSANIELVPKQIKLGGNGPIMANALRAQGHKIIYIGALGKEYIHPVFREFASKIYAISLSDPGHTDALEFNDGKIMLGKLKNLEDINWNNLIQKLSEKKLLDILKKVSLIAITNWTMLPELNSIIQGFYGLMSEIKDPPFIFIDLADPQKRTKQDITGILDLMGKLEEKTEVILGMNKHESVLISNVLKIKENVLTLRAQAIRDKLNITAVVIHPVDRAVVAYSGDVSLIDGPYTPYPKISTGAGDNFNAGFCNGWLTGLTPEECLVVGVCTSGFYVRNEYSPDRKELLEFMKNFEM